MRYADVDCYASITELVHCARALCAAWIATSEHGFDIENSAARFADLSVKKL